ncbi:MAG: hypothetical protein ACOC6H_03690 [Thermoproteota archaeon]
MKAVMDTSALISLQVAHLIPKALQITQIVVPPLIVEELKEMSSYPDQEGQAAHTLLHLIRKERIEEIETQNKKKVKSLLSADVDPGEAECLVCCLENQIGLLIIGDVDAAYALQSYTKIHNVDLKISVAVISELVQREKITPQQALKAVKKISHIREWQGGVLQVLARKYFPQL